MRYKYLKDSTQDPSEMLMGSVYNWSQFLSATRKGRYWELAQSLFFEDISRHKELKGVDLERRSSQKGW